LFVELDIRQICLHPRWKGIPVRAITNWTIENWVNKSNGFKHDVTIKTQLYIDEVEGNSQKRQTTCVGSEAPTPTPPRWGPPTVVLLAGNTGSPTVLTKNL
jgi:hypothetical protein